jgi:hypothetical protein
MFAGLSAQPAPGSAARQMRQMEKTYREPKPQQNQKGKLKIPGSAGELFGSR